MTHVRTDHQSLNSKREFRCGIGPSLPEGDRYVFEGEAHLHRMVDCPACGGSERRNLGTPISELSGRPGHDGYEEFCRIARSWGYD